MVDVEALLRENAEHRRALEAQRADLAAQRAQIAKLIDQIAKLNDRIGELLAIAERKQRKPCNRCTTPVFAGGVVGPTLRGCS